MTASTHYVLGLPGSGKSTFLAALWYLCGRAPLPHGLRAMQRGGQTEYITDLSSRWLEARRLVKTRVGESAQVAIELVDESTGRNTGLVFPDASGEEFQLGYTHREWPNTLVDGVRQAAGIVLFLHPFVAKPRSLAAATTAWLAVEGRNPAARVSPDSDHSGAAPALPHSASEERELPTLDLKKCPTAVQLVDLLQSVALVRGRSGRTPLTVVTSAWDLIPERTGDKVVTSWLSREVPLLMQFLNTRTDLFETEYIAISAQGGDVTKDEVRRELLALDDPRDRIEVATDNRTDANLLRLIEIVARWDARS